MTDLLSWIDKCSWSCLLASINYIYCEEVICLFSWILMTYSKANNSDSQIGLTSFNSCARLSLESMIDSSRIGAAGWTLLLELSFQTNKITCIPKRSDARQQHQSFTKYTTLCDSVLLIRSNVYSEWWFFLGRVPTCTQLFLRFKALEFPFWRVHDLPRVCSVLAYLPLQYRYYSCKL